MSNIDLLLSSTTAAVVARHDIPGKPEQLKKLPASYLKGRLFDVMKLLTRGRGHAWVHQGVALELLMEAKNIVLATSTGSGKSLVFQADMIRRMIDDPAATGFALYPAKALAWDQLVRWREAFAAAGIDESLVAEVNADTPFSERDAILKRARLIVGTPDIIHAWFMRMLPSPDAQRFISALQLVVIDEAHDLNGVFGSNCALLFRRIRTARNRSRANSGLPAGELSFVAASATIADPAKHLQDLTGLHFEVIGEDQNGAPRHPKTLLHIEGAEFGLVAESNLAVLVEEIAGKIGSDALVAFADGRKVVENVAASIGSDQVEPYRAGYGLEDRTAIAEGMHDGSLNAVVATSSLELGIDVAAFSVGLNLGVPTSMKAFRQRVGRVGRSGPGVFAIIAEPSAFAKLGTSLREFYEGEPEDCCLYLENPIVQVQNACCLIEECGAGEVDAKLPDDVEWPAGFEEAFRMAHPAALRPREIDHVLTSGASGNPHIDHPLRRIGDGKFALRLAGGDGSLVGTIDDAKALREAYPGGVYRHRKTPYKVVEWRSSAYERTIYLRRAAGYARTTPILLTQVGVSHSAGELLEDRLLAGETGSLAEVRMQVSEAVIGYRAGANDLLYRDLSQKDRRLARKQRNFSTTGIVIQIDEPWFRGKSGAAAEMRERVGKALATILIRERGIAGGEVRWEHSGIASHGSGGPRVLDNALVIFDDLPGGLRLTSPLFAEIEQYLDRLRRGAQLAGPDALLDEVSVARLVRWYEGLQYTDGGGGSPPALSSHQRLIYAPQSLVGVRIKGDLKERRILGHQLIEVAGSELLFYSYESAPGVHALVPHEHVEQIGHDWRQVLWDTSDDSIQELAA